jgi:hypothetical protein
VEKLVAARVKEGLTAETQINAEIFKGREKKKKVEPQRTQRAQRKEKK